MNTNVTSVFDEPKIDSHCHILDPAKFTYSPDSKYHPPGQEIGTAVQIAEVFKTSGIRNALLVPPNSGYGEDNRCLLAASGGSSEDPCCYPTA
jgi:predicted TIM-barrel fold metal-dependent hydrolase